MNSALPLLLMKPKATSHVAFGFVFFLELRNVILHLIAEEPSFLDKINSLFILSS